MITDIDIRKKLAHDAPQNDKELYRYIRDILGFAIPTKAVMPENSSPFKFLSDLFFERVADCVVLANRKGGKTRCLSILHHLNSLFKKGCWTTSVGAIDRQAQRAYDYLQEYTNYEKNKDNNISILYKDDIIRTIKSETTYKNGSKVEILPGTLNQVSGPHPQKAILDEVEKSTWEIVQQFIGMPHSAEDIRGQTIFTSTRETSFGTMQRLLDRAKRIEMIIYRWSIWETMKKCPKCEKSKCELWETCQGKALESDGYIPKSDVVRLFLMWDKETWEAQALCQKPSRKGLVYQDFSSANIQKYEPDLSKDIWIGFDEGYSEPRVILFAQIDGDNLYIFDEIYEVRKQVEETIESIRNKGYRGLQGWGDRSAPKEIDKLNMQEWIQIKPAPISSIRDGISEVRRRIKDNRGKRTLFIDPVKCPHTLQEIDKYRMKENSEEPVDKDNHCLDALRYIVMGLVESGELYSIFKNLDKLDSSIGIKGSEVDKSVFNDDLPSPFEW